MSIIVNLITIPFFVGPLKDGWDQRHKRPVEEGDWDASRKPEEPAA